jgi:hypothetical protein
MENITTELRFPRGRKQFYFRLGSLFGGFIVPDINAFVVLFGFLSVSDLIDFFSIGTALVFL